jgi:chorismate mutase-like protein
MDIKEVRRKIDKIDREIINLIAERQSYMEFVVKYKSKNDLDVYIPEREKEVIFSRRKIAQEQKVNPDFIETIFKEIIKECKKIQNKFLKK